MLSNDSPLARPLPDAQRLWEESERLLASYSASTPPLDPGAAIDAICRAARNLMEADGACVILRENELVHYAREDTVAPLWAGQKFPIGNCISGWSILHRQRVIIEDIYDDERIPVEYYRQTFVRSLAMQPIAPQNPVGAIGVYWKRRHRATAGQLDLLRKLARVAAIVLENSRLREEVQKTGAGHGHRDDFLATVAHELRSPLDAILGWVSLLQRTETSPEALARALDVIEHNARSQARLIEDLVDTSRIHSGKLDVDTVTVDVDSMVRAALDATRPAAHDRNIDLTIDMRGAGAINGDGQRLQQVMRNVLANAVKFTPEGGHIGIVVERAGAHVTIAITDNGIGIRPELLPHVFDRYRQGDDAGAHCRSGLGLGLSISRQIVEMHGGEIRLESDGVGKGTTVTVRLPVTRIGDSVR